MKWLRIIIILIFIPLLAFYKDTNGEWQLQRNRNNISVYSRPLDNGEKMEMKAETIVESSLSCLV
ncbi:MAG: hypothetical protein H0X62_08795, partial [Bacteroidetes bacterium]|nr:hypothetical protein [Bacteroidota bacterium]